MRVDLQSGERAKATLLLVEDEQTLRLVAKKVLTAEGYRVVEAASGEEAVDLARRHGEELSLLITDLVLPGLSGESLVEDICRHSPVRGCLFMSGYSEETAPTTSPALATRFLAKPFTAVELTRTVAELLAQGERY